MIYNDTQKKMYYYTTNLYIHLLDSVKAHKFCLLFWNLTPLLQYWCNPEWHTPLLDSFLALRLDQGLKRVFILISYIYRYEIVTISFWYDKHGHDYYVSANSPPPVPSAVSTICDSWTLPYLPFNIPVHLSNKNLVR